MKNTMNSKTTCKFKKIMKIIPRQYKRVNHARTIRKVHFRKTSVSQIATKTNKNTNFQTHDEKKMN